MAKKKKDKPSLKETIKDFDWTLKEGREAIKKGREVSKERRRKAHESIKKGWKLMREGKEPETYQDQVKRKFGGGKV